MNSTFVNIRRSLLVAAGLMAAAPSPGAATILIAFDDSSPGASIGILRDTSINHAVQWTQTVLATEVTLRAILRASDRPFAPVPASLNWYVTNAIGGGTTAANIIASGSVALPTFPFSPDFDDMQLTTLATGLSLTAGTYYLVFDGPASGDGEWWGDFTGITTTLAPGFSIDNYFATTSPDAFAPASSFVATTNQQFVFELESVTTPVPEPSAWAMMLLGFCGIALATRRAKTRLARPSLMAGSQTTLEDSGC